MSKLKIYLKLSLRNVLNNKRYFLPYALSLSIFASLIHILSAINVGLKGNPEKFAASNTSIMLEMAIIIISVFTFAVSLSTNRFLRKNRRREHGLYSLLGMKKSHIASLSILESLSTIVFSFLLSIVSAFVFSKLFSLIYFSLMKMPGENIELSIESLSSGALLSLVIFLFNSFSNVFSSAFLNPIKTLRSASFAEREPKAKIIPALIGFILLGAGYYLSLKLSLEPISLDSIWATEAITNFFWAVIAVIIGTYILMMLGFTVIIKVFKSRKSFYYKKNHFISLSSLMYRVRQNGMALGTIIILSCAVIVTMTMTLGLYDKMNERIDREFTKSYIVDANISFEKNKLGKEELFESAKKLDESFMKAINDKAEENQINISDFHKKLEYNLIQKNLSSIKIDGESFGISTIKKISENPQDSKSILPEEVFDAFNIIIKFKSLEDVDDPELINKLNFHEDKENVYIFINDIIGIHNNIVFKDIEFGEEKFKVSSVMSYSSNNPEEITIVFKDRNLMEKAYFSAINKQLEFEKNNNIEGEWYQMINAGYSFNIDKKDFQKLNDNQLRYFADEIISEVEVNDVNNGNIEFSSKNVFDTRMMYHTMFGSLLFIGVIISTAFLIATALIMFYKFYSEGLDDRNRYRIMQNIGLSLKETKSVIKRQTVVIFSMPILITAIHMFFASFGMNSMFLVLSGFIGVGSINLFLIIIGIVYLFIYFMFYFMGYKAYELGVKGR